jgi:hypothetical protein
MKQSVYFLSFIFLGVSLLSCAQTKTVIKKADAFIAVHTPGNIPVLENGDQSFRADTSVMIYARVADTAIRWRSVFFNSHEYMVHASKVSGTVTPGIDKSNGNIIRISPQKGYSLMLLTLEKKQKDDTAAVTNAGIILTAVYKGKKIKYLISSFTELALQPSQ